MTSNIPDEELALKVKEWMEWDQNCTTKAEIQQLVDQKKYEYLKQVLCQRMSFGTAGLRGKMCAGYARMNDLVIVQTAQGLLKHLENQYSEALNKNGLVLGYDARHNSERFAQLTAQVFLSQGYKVRLFSKTVPTPFVPFAVWKYKTAAGVMVTASHNPKDDNGYKVYGSNGCQIIPPDDKNIQKEILNNLKPWDKSWDLSLLKSPNLIDPLAETSKDYYKILSDSILPEYKSNSGNLKIAYSAMHGVGYPYILDAMKIAGIDVVPVKEQVMPDPDFPTVTYPNPEEGNSMEYSIKTADAEGCDLILANDPDADRLAIAVRIDSGEWRKLTGNEIGVLLGWWLLSNFEKRFPDVNLDNVYMLASTVSSKFLRGMAEKKGFHFIETLTGFKWMGNEAFDLIHNEGKKVVFAYEEAIGYMCGDGVLDKDGVSAALHFATMAMELHRNGLRVDQQLNELFTEYGYHITNNSYYFCHDPPTITKIFERLRNFNGPQSYPNSIMNGVCNVTSVRDLTVGYDNSQPNNKPILPVSKGSQMITFEFDNGLICTLRTSGTEPKIKYYTELCDSSKDASYLKVGENLKMLVDGLTTELLEPKKNNLAPSE
ncbi:PREDICTED: phosphoglucomutase-2 [Nicrophorus vespilloides]|uniref:Phosphoglucomutase-2 n=1 Tax=Nicrophorus vespilloides TaxID=110193 RepID=A0ABM1N4L0_NICVS|nr:PREDICTED: phosphoglucomutase-2 [Nicrophorus vespilloides]